MPVLCEYSPVRMLERLGQQSAVVTNPFGKVTPELASSRTTFGITGVGTGAGRACSVKTVSQRWSSVRIRMRFGRPEERGISCAGDDGGAGGGAAHVAGV